MEWVETTGRTVEEAKDAALDQLGVDEQDAEFDVVEEPKTGLFGRLRGEARVRARVRPTRPRAKEDRRERRRTRDRDKEKDRDRQAPRDGAERDAREPAAAGATTSVAAASAPAGAAGGGERRRSRGGGSGNGDDERGAAVPEFTLAEQGEMAGEFVRGLVREMGATATVSVSEVDQDTVQVNVEGEELGLLIGPRGQTLAALQELTRTVVQRRTGGREGWVLVDVAGYRKKRREALERFVRQVADQVKESGMATALDPMSAADRKVVHDTINDIDGVTTTSEGEEPRRRVVVHPG